jgi:hypothetical protein
MPATPQYERVAAEGPPRFEPRVVSLPMAFRRAGDVGLPRAGPDQWSATVSQSR